MGNAENVLKNGLQVINVARIECLLWNEEWYREILGNCLGAILKGEALKIKHLVMAKLPSWW